ncbi:alpha-aspartyl dipeptidase peptidase E [Liquorilactobacillus sucicola DSM 21376 = JCM 15457]|uniref:Peptidase E n=1 Tax=Liquorilactobacillus sucicola DSM 21376 = JCM 15457 TaxID=1423806 RepID=A0A023D037_9LACO|nr:Type 1 glutamine amidotransferase-like domain-containing protein [Liquorilactobacillus sucicola]KRN06616.1 Peptidase E [Liquorilactobacillus sucicola DSM 21376 = JCM 15457]GAJ27125.1 alpha-aspartyl dipeptidase peptidase E [Liquorilactobacillus sucicola DSM 21376 = JCM 15457]
MKKIFLTSYFAGTTEIFTQFAAANSITSKKVLYIPTASNVEEYTGYIDEGKETLEKLGFTIEEFDIAQGSKTAALSKIASAEILFIAGGNTFYLLQELKDKHLLLPIREKINSGLPYIGESAGAIILAPDIEYNKIMDTPTAAPKLTNYTALDVVDFYTLPHYIEEPFTETVQTTFKTYRNKLKLIPISNSEAIVVSDSNYSIVRRP